MDIVHILCAVDAFWVTREGHGIFGDELRIGGWFLSHSDTVGMEIVFDGTNERLAIDSFQEESGGVWNHHGNDFGERALRCRFYGALKMPDGPIDLSTARFRVSMSDGHVFERILGAPTFPETDHPYTPDESELIMSFESLGDNCEFGLVQRHVGTERLSLFRYSGVYDAIKLAEVIRARFDGFAEGDDLEIQTFGPEWVGHVRSVGMGFHTGRIQGLITKEKIEREERSKLQFLAQKFIDDVEDARKILVYRTLRGERGGPEGTYGMDEVYDALATIGPNPLLWVNEADDDHPHGSIWHIRENLYRGFIRRLCPYDDAHSGDDRGWIELLANAQRVIRGAQGQVPGSQELATSS